VSVDYEPLQAITTPQQAIEPGAIVIRDEKEGQTDNKIYHWEAGDKDATDAAFARRCQGREPRDLLPTLSSGAARDVRLRRRPRPVTGNATIYMTSQAPHAHRTLFAIVAGLPEEKIRIISPDLGVVSATRSRSIRDMLSPPRRRC